MIKKDKEVRSADIVDNGVKIFGFASVNILSFTAMPNMHLYLFVQPSKVSDGLLSLALMGRTRFLHVPVSLTFLVEAFVPKALILYGVVKKGASTWL